MGVKTIIITGASSDIAYSYIKLLSKKNEEYRIIAQYNQSMERIDELQNAFDNIEIIPIQCDLSIENSVLEFIDSINNLGFDVYGIVHIAAPPMKYQRIRQLDMEQFNRSLFIQVDSMALLMKTFLPGMAKRRKGKILGLLSAVTLGTPPKFLSDYIVSKYALLGLLKAAASEYSGKGIQINGISPEMIETRFLDGIDSRIVEMNAKNSALGRNLKPEDVAESMYFLMDENNIMNGINLNLTAGNIM